MENQPQESVSIPIVKDHAALTLKEWREVRDEI